MRGMQTWAALALVAVGAACESPTKPPVAVGSVVIGPGTAVLASGDSIQLGLIVRDANGNELSGRPVTWSSLDTTRAVVSATGKVTARKNRNAASISVFVRATVGGVFDDAEIIVSPLDPASLTLSPVAGTIDEGESPTVAFTLLDDLGVPLANRQLTWTSRDTTIVTVSSTGQLTPRPFIDVNTRSTRIVASLGGVSDSITVTVSPATLASIAIAPQEPYLRVGYSKRLRIVGTTTGGSQVRGLAATFSSSNASVATTTAAGLVTASTNTGSTDIVAEYGTLRDTVSLTVDACGAASPGGYTMQLINVGPGLSPDAQAAFDCAVARIRAVIRQPISLVTFATETPTGANCFSQNIAAGTNTTGVIIYIRVAPIDGVSGVLGRAGPCLVRSTSRLAVVGLMEFDDADIANLAANGTLLPVILHEMLHVVGIGTAWRDGSLPGAPYSGDGPDPGFRGEAATRECRNEHGGTLTCAVQVPIENCTGIPGCGQGTIYGHWRELTFDSELMTGYIDPPRPAFSRMTIAALGDMGYSVDLEQAEDYVMPTPLLRLDGGRMPGLRLPAPVQPTHSVDANGRLRPLLR